MTEWSNICRETIERVALTVPEGATLKERKALVDAAYPFGRRAYWPYKAWLKARRAYLTPYGYKQTKTPAPLFADLERDPVTGRPVIK